MDRTGRLIQRRLALELAGLAALADDLRQHLPDALRVSAGGRPPSPAACAAMSYSFRSVEKQAHAVVVNVLNIRRNFSVAVGAPATASSIAAMSALKVLAQMASPIACLESKNL
jgi:hypothetical protein